MRLQHGERLAHLLGKRDVDIAHDLADLHRHALELPKGRHHGGKILGVDVTVGVPRETAAADETHRHATQASQRRRRHRVQVCRGRAGRTGHDASCRFGGPTNRTYLSSEVRDTHWEYTRPDTADPHRLGRCTIAFSRILGQAAVLDRYTHPSILSRPPPSCLTRNHLRHHHREVPRLVGGWRFWPRRAA